MGFIRFYVDSVRHGFSDGDGFMLIWVLGATAFSLQIIASFVIFEFNWTMIRVIIVSLFLSSYPMFPYWAYLNKSKK